MFQDRVFTIAIVASILLHAVFLIFLPGVRLLEEVIQTEWLEVELLDAPEVDIQITQAGSDGSQNAIREGDLVNNSELFPSPPVWVPERLSTVNTEPVAMKLVMPTDYLPDISGTGMQSPAEILEMGSGSLIEPDSLANRDQPPDMTWKPSQDALPSPDPGDESAWQITGEVALRKVIYRPPAPRPETSISGSVHLKFWVLPDGTIDKIVPIMRGDPDVERIAREFLQKWRFEAVDESVGRQSGSIPVRFKMR